MIETKKPDENGQSKAPDMIEETVARADNELAYLDEEPEIVTVGDSGISLILPDKWKGKYGYEFDGNNMTLYHLATRENSEYGGDLFRVYCDEGRYSMEYVYPEPGFTIAITDTHTYRVCYPSDVQHAPELWAAYDELYAEVGNIEIVMTDEMLMNTMNASNWIPGTVLVNFLKDFGAGGIEKTVICDTEQSQLIREIIASQNYREPESFHVDLWIMFNREEYYLNSVSGKIMMASGGYSAVLSTEDLSRIVELLGD